MFGKALNPATYLETVDVVPRGFIACGKAVLAIELTGFCRLDEDSPMHIFFPYDTCQSLCSTSPKHGRLWRDELSHEVAKDTLQH